MARKKEEKPRLDRYSWLAQHPEDLPLDAENQRSRQIGYDNDGFRSLSAAICLQACVDYKKASMGNKVDGKEPKEVLKECREFFGGDMFQFFVNRLSVKEIEKNIRATPPNAIHSIWHSKENRTAHNRKRP